MIIFNNAITKIKYFKKVKYYTGGRVVPTYKNFIGWKYRIIPQYEVLHNVVVNVWNSSFICTVEEYNEKNYNNSYIEDGIFYFKPHCNISLSDGSMQSKFFDTPEQLMEFINDLKNLSPHIVIE